MRGVDVESRRHPLPAGRQSMGKVKSTSAKIRHLANERCPVPFFFKPLKLVVP